MNQRLSQTLRLAAAALAAALCGSALAADTAVVYFSRAENVEGVAPEAMTSASLARESPRQGSTAMVARLVAQAAGADVFPLRVARPYPAAFRATIDRNHAEQEAGALPELVSHPDLSGYETVYLGFPIWNRDAPRAVETFLRQASETLRGKRVRLFCTHDGYGPGASFERVAETLSGSRTDTDGLAIRSDALGTAGPAVNGWMKKDADAAGRRRIVAEVAGETVEITLNGSPEARQFARRLPLSATMGEFGGREFYGPSPVPITVSSEGQYTFADGTLTYCPTNDTVAIFYAQSSRPRLTMAVYPMGRVTSDLSVFSRLPGRARFSFRAGAE